MGKHNLRQSSTQEDVQDASRQGVRVCACTLMLFPSHNSSPLSLHNPSSPLCLLQLSELFLSFEEKPQGAASLAQVHKAVLHDGKTVAVKIQHPKVQKQSANDILVMEVSLCLFNCFWMSQEMWGWSIGLMRINQFNLWSVYWQQLCQLVGLSSTLSLNSSVPVASMPDEHFWNSSSQELSQQVPG